MKNNWVFCPLSESNPSLNTLLPSPGAWPYSASDSPLNNAHNSGNKIFFEQFPHLFKQFAESFITIFVPTAKYAEYKPSWPPEPIGHNKPWKTNRNTSQLPRPPPGLTSQKQPSVSPWAGGAPRLGRSWGGSGGSQETRYGSGIVMILVSKFVLFGTKSGRNVFPLILTNYFLI